jgi:hypothetical protein
VRWRTDVKHKQREVQQRRSFTVSELDLSFSVAAFSR